MLKQLSEGKLYVPLMQAIDIYTDMGRFTIAAKHHETIAGIFESEVHTWICLKCIQVWLHLIQTNSPSVQTWTRQCNITSR